jgi:hypothetical protein
MPRRRVLVQLDNDWVERLDRLAGHLAVTRSEFLRRGALAVLQADALRQADRAKRHPMTVGAPSRSPYLLTATTMLSTAWRRPSSVSTGRSTLSARTTSRSPSTARATSSGV